MNKKEIIKYLKENELNVQSAPASIIALDLVYVGYIDSDEIHGIKYSPIFSHICSKNLKPFYQIIPQKIITKISAKIYFDYCKNPKSLENKIKKHKRLQKELDILWKKRLEMEPLDLYKKFIKISRKWWQYGSIGEDKAEVINQEITPRFAKRHNLKTKEAQEIMNILSFPKIQSVFNLERRNFLEICLDFLDKKVSDKKINNYIKKYFWFKTDFYKTKHITPEFLKKEILKETKKRNKRSILKELKEIKNHFEKIHSQKKKIIKKLKITKQDKKDIYFAEQAVYWFDQRKERMMTQLYYLFSFLEDLAKKHHLNYYDLADCTVEELEFFLKNKKEISKAEKKKREKGVFLVYEKNKKVKMFYGKDAQELFDISLSSEEKEIRGQVASTGGIKKIKGKVSIISNPDKETFNKGDILITSMTRIEFLPFMRKAKAIVTNEGGIACHAAIVSRELNIPCIIGTKIATKVLKDGDLVEVDASKGVVKILKKK